jgi:hypothetical protein
MADRGYEVLHPIVDETLKHIRGEFLVKEVSNLALEPELT